MFRCILRFLGWVNRKPGQIWPFPFAGFEPLKKDKPILIDREGVAYLPSRRVVLKARKS
jgi:hypothetical protein